MHCPQAERLKTTNIYFLIMSVCQEARQGSGCLWFKISDENVLKCWSGLWSHLRAQWGRAVAGLVACHMGLSAGLPRHGFLRASDP